MPITLIKTQTYGENQSLATTDPYHFNVNNGLRVHGSGLQDIARVLVMSHHHVDPYLFVNGSRTSEPYGADVRDIHGSTLKNSLPKYVWNGTADTGKYGEYNIYTATGADFNKLLDGLGYLLYWVSSSQNSSFSLEGFMGSGVEIDSQSPYHQYNPQFYYDFAQNIYVESDNRDYSRDRFGFTPFTFFAGPLYPEGIALSGDVGGNLTFAQHVADSSIHGGSSGNLPDLEDLVDLNLAYHGFLNVYDVAQEGISLNDPNTRRISDDYLFNEFDNYEDDALEKIFSYTSEISHPLLYEEGIYLWQDRKLRQFKTIKSDPDDMQLSSERIAAAPLDSLFVGAESSYDFLRKKNTTVIHNHLDTYFHNNRYVKYQNFEYDGDEKYVVGLHMNEGRGYQTNRGFVSGI